MTSFKMVSNLTLHGRTYWQDPNHFGQRARRPPANDASAQANAGPRRRLHIWRLAVWPSVDDACKQVNT